MYMYIYNQLYQRKAEKHCKHLPHVTAFIDCFDGDVIALHKHALWRQPAHRDAVVVLVKQVVLLQATTAGSCFY